MVDTFPEPTTNILPILSQLASIFGINAQIIGIVITIILALMISMACYLYFGSIFIALLGTNGVLLASIFIGFVPFWIGFVFAIIATGYFIIAGSSETSTQPTATDNPDKWIEYGNRLKLAYTAKFGGENTGFNQEVDYRINIMQHNRRGFTHTIARDWLKRMERFTEAKR